MIIFGLFYFRDHLDFELMAFVRFIGRETGALPLVPVLSTIFAFDLRLPLCTSVVICFPLYFPINIILAPR